LLKRVFGVDSQRFSGISTQKLIKETGSAWFPDSPSARVEILEVRGAPGRLGIQGFLAETEDPNDDSLTVWIEWLDAPDTIPPVDAAKSIRQGAGSK
jgi:hypothetical protein